jgi:hypothetical protein
MLFLRTCLAGLIAISLFAQVQNARVEGTVTDSTQSVIPGATVTIVNTRTQASVTAQTDADGHYQFPALSPGFHTLTAEANGFKKETITNIEVTVGISLRQDLRLEIGTVSDTLTVEANAVSVTTTDATIQRAVTLRDIDTLPQLGRGPIALATFQPGVVLGTSPNDPSFARINGMRQGSNNNTLDGIDVNDAVSPRLGLTLNANNTDSVSEFRIITNGAKAEYGRNAGGTVELITRSGTNVFHGNLFEYHRNTVFNANNFFNKSSGTEIARPEYIQNQFGGSFGGPVVLPKFNGKNKLFFFFNYQGSRVAQQVVRNRTVLTATAKAGIFRWTVPAGAPGAGTIQSYNIVTNDPRHIGIDKLVAKSLAILPDPNNNDVGDGLNTAGFRFNAPANNQGDQYTGKADWNATNNIHTYFRYSWFKTLTPADTLNNAEQTYPGQPNGTQGGIRSGYSTGVTWTAKQWLINEFVIGIQESSVDFGRVRSQYYAGQTVLTPNLYTAAIPTGFGSARNSPVNPQINDNVSMIRGRHTFKTGVRFSSIDEFSTNDANIWPTANLGQGSGNAPPSTIGPAAATIAAADRARFDNLYNDLLGRPASIATTFYSDLSTFSAGKPKVRNIINRDYGYYFQDDWRVTDNLTLNLGLRYEFYGVPFERDGLQGSVVQNDQGLVNTVGNISNLTVAKSSSWYKNDWNNFAPRFGFAWSPSKDRKTSIRASVGMFYDRVPGTANTKPDGNTPGFAQGVTVFPNQAAGSDVRLSDSNLLLPTPPATPTLTPAADRTFGVINLIDPNFRQPYVIQANITVQREILRNTVMEMGLVSNRGMKLWADQNVDETKIYSNGFLNDFKELQAYQKNSTSPISPGNNLVKLYGTPAAAIAGVGATNLQQGAVGQAATSVDTAKYTSYASVGLSPYYIRNFPQFTNVWIGTNLGRSSYDSLQLSVRRQTGSLKFAANYTWSKTIDNGSGDGGTNTNPLESFNFKSMRGLSDADRPHTFNFTTSYTLPIGRNKFVGHNMPDWVDRFVGGWEIGVLGIKTSGQPLSISSGVFTGPNTTNFGPLTNNNMGALANYSGTDRSIGKVEEFGGGVRYFTQAQLALFSVADAGSIGTSGRNTFRGPGFFDIDASLVKRFRVTEKIAVVFRAEAYDLLNTVNFSAPSVNLQTPTSFGIISSTPTGASNQSGARILQLALRLEF